MIVIKVSVQGIISAQDYFSDAPQCSLDESQRDHFCNSFINVFKTLEEKEIVEIKENLMAMLEVM